MLLTPAITKKCEKYNLNFCCFPLLDPSSLVRRISLVIRNDEMPFHPRIKLEVIQQLLKLACCFSDFFALFRFFYALPTDDLDSKMPIYAKTFSIPKICWNSISNILNRKAY